METSGWICLRGIPWFLDRVGCGLTGDLSRKNDRCCGRELGKDNRRYKVRPPGQRLGASSVLVGVVVVMLIGVFFRGTRQWYGRLGQASPVSLLPSGQSVEGYIPGPALSGFGVVVQRDTDGASVVAVVLTDDLLAVELPEPRIVVAACRNQVGAVCAEGTVPHPALVAGEGRLEGEGLGLILVGDGLHILDLPDLGRMVGTAGGQLLDIGGEEDAGDVFLVRREVGQGDELRSVVGLKKLPDEDIALNEGKMLAVEWGDESVRSYIVVRCTEQGAVTRDCDAGYRHVLLGDQLMRACVLG